MIKMQLLGGLSFLGMLWALILMALDAAKNDLAHEIIWAAFFIACLLLVIGARIVLEIRDHH